MTVLAAWLTNPHVRPAEHPLHRPGELPCRMCGIRRPGCEAGDCPTRLPERLVPRFGDHPRVGGESDPTLQPEPASYAAPAQGERGPCVIADGYGQTAEERAGRAAAGGCAATFTQQTPIPAAVGASGGASRGTPPPSAPAGPAVEPRAGSGRADFHSETPSSGTGKPGPNRQDPTRHGVFHALGGAISPDGAALAGRTALALNGSDAGTAPPTFLLEFQLDGEPKGWDRTTPVGYGRSFKTKTQRGYEAAIATAARLAMGAGGLTRQLIRGPVRVCATGYIAVPKSAGKTRWAMIYEGKYFPTKRPDCDNLLKSVLDALTGVVYVDDAQVVEVRGAKVWAEKPSLRVRVEGL